MDKNKTVPKQEKGAKTDTAAEVSFDDIDAASRHFHIAEKRLLHVSDWENLCGKASANFTLTDSAGRQVDREAQQQDHIRIDIPGPGTQTGEGNDWVYIEAIVRQDDPHHDHRYTAIRVRPASNPENERQDTAHFFKEDATSTFIVEQTGKTIRAEVHGRNELPNTDAQGVIDTVRNAFVAIGAMLGASNPQWKSLVEGLVKK